MLKALPNLLCLFGLLFANVAAAEPVPAPSLAEKVEIRRTAYGVPHILGEDLASVFFGLAYCHVEDYGERVVTGLLGARGELAIYQGSEAIESDAFSKQTHQRAVETYHLLDQDIRDVFRGYAGGVNHYVQLHPGEFQDWTPPHFNGHDVAALWIVTYNQGKVRRFIQDLVQEKKEEQAQDTSEEGSNAWAFAPGRTKSGHSILVRNPHLNWDAGYYEAHITVPGVINFYGDLRIGHPLFYNGGFNDNLGWATTNNNPDFEEIYALEVDPENPDHYLMDGGSVPLTRKTVTIEFKNGEGSGIETRDFLMSPLGPVIYRGGGKIYVVRSAGDGEYRGALQFLRMMQAAKLDEWKEAMRMRAQLGSNFTYADREGNIFYLWNGTIPDLPHPPGRDKEAIPARTSSDVWTRLVDFDSLPQVLNPPGGYLHNENDPYHFANLNTVLKPEDFPPSLPEPRLRLRSQHSLQLLHNDRQFSLEEIVEMKHSMRMLLADRVKDDLVSAVKKSEPDEEVRKALKLIEDWDNTVAVDSKGGVLFEAWFQRYLAAVRPEQVDDPREAWDAAFHRTWNFDEPVSTPYGLSDLEKAAAAFKWAVEETRKIHGSWDVPWGEVHRMRMGDIDLPVGGCPGALGCFRVFWFTDAEDGKRTVAGGDGWVLAVEFADPPRAYSVLAYGQSSREDSPHFDDQAEMFSSNKMKKVAFTEAEIREQLIRKYRPGKEW